VFNRHKWKLLFCRSRKGRVCFEKSNWAKHLSRCPLLMTIGGCGNEIACIEAYEKAFIVIAGFKVQSLTLIAIFFSQWERVKTSVQSLQQITMGGIEEVMESAAYGIEVSIGKSLQKKQSRHGLNLKTLRAVFEHSNTHYCMFQFSEPYLNPTHADPSYFIFCLAPFPPAHVFAHETTKTPNHVCFFCFQ
jgi:hypothetical protein